MRRRKKDKEHCKMCGTCVIVPITFDPTTNTGLCGLCCGGKDRPPPIVVPGEIAIGKEGSWILPDREGGLSIGTPDQDEIDLFADEAQALLRELIKLYPLNALVRATG